MRPAHIVQIVTPKKVELNGLWFGPKKAKRAIVWVHGLGSSAFTKFHIVDELVNKNTAVLVFNNRGSGKVATTSYSSGKRARGGAAHEVFTDCVDDIQGAINFAKRAGAKNVTLAGHSTGCQKSVYWAAKRGRGADSIVILAPMSDYAAELKLSGKAKLSRALIAAKKLIKAGKPHELLPENVWSWSWLADAQRFISAYSGDSEEEIFTYWNEKKPRTLMNVKTPLLVLLAGADEYADRPAAVISEWFMKWLYTGHVVIIPKVKHSFKGGEKAVAAAVRDFLKTL
jgi:alpha-beta hydrolase superfamily lysophospholipase